MMNLSPRQSVSLAEHTTLKVGGKAEYLVSVSSVEELQLAVAWAHARSIPYYILGGGSNVLFTEAGYAGLVIVVCIHGREYVPQANGTVIATLGAGEVLDTVVAETTERGWWGLENLSHIPGTVGATPVQNVGAYGVEMSDVITAVEVYDTSTQTTTWLTPKQCQFGYRDSIFKSVAGNVFIIVRVQCRLSTEQQARLEYADLATLVKSTQVLTSHDVRQTVISIRAQKFPDWKQVGTAGSFFKNPVVDTTFASDLQKRFPQLPAHAVSSTDTKIALGYVLDKICHRKGYRNGNVGLSAAQALVLIAYPGATADEVVHFAEEIIADVYAATGLRIEREVTLVSATT